MDKKGKKGSNRCQKVYEKRVSSNESYVVKMAGSSSGKIGIALSDNTCQLCAYDSSEFRQISSLDGQSGDITDVRFAPNDDNVLYFSSADGSIKLWDVRTKSKSLDRYEENPASREFIKPLSSFDVSHNGRILCGGSDLIQNDAFVLFWDVRSKDLLGGYWNSHTDEVVQVKFSKNKSNNLVSGGADGLVNVFDISEPSEDDALQYSLSVDCAVDKLGWTSASEIACLTQNIDVQRWNVETADQTETYTREDVAKAMKKTTIDDCYIVDIYDESPTKLTFLTGSYAEEGYPLKMVECSDGRLSLRSVLYGNAQIVRCSWWDVERNLIIAGGEAGTLSMWNCSDESAAGEDKNSHSVSSVKEKMKSHKKKPY